MSAKLHRVKQVAEIAGVTVRTLHHYEAVGLLAPSGRSEAGYRLYDEGDLLRLQQILIWRELDLPLEQIRQLLDDPAFDRRAALTEQRRQLVLRGQQTAAMIRSVDAALELIDGGRAMDEKKLFDGFDPAEHEREVKERWGNTDAYKEASRRTKRYGKEDWARMKAEGDGLLQQLATKMQAGSKPTDDDVVELAEQHRLHIDRWFYPCSRGMHAGLAEMYVADSRFTESFDKHGEGLAAFLADAIRANLDRG